MAVIPLPDGVLAETGPLANIAGAPVVLGRMRFVTDQEGGAFYVDSGAAHVKVGSVDSANVVDNLTTTSTTQPLSANQGKLINDQLAGLGTMFTVANMAGRAAIPAGTLTVNDRVLVEDRGDGKWEEFRVTAVTNGSGGTSTYISHQNENQLAVAMTAAQIKTSYESNADTNAFTDAEKAAIGAGTAATTANTAAIALNTAARHTHAVPAAVPNSLGTGLQVWRTNAAATAGEWATSPAGVTTWLELTDTPAAFIANNLSGVNAAGNALEMVSGIGGGTF